MQNINIRKAQAIASNNKPYTVLDHKKKLRHGKVTAINKMIFYRNLGNNSTANKNKSI